MLVLIYTRKGKNVESGVKDKTRKREERKENRRGLRKKEEKEKKKGEEEKKREEGSKCRRNKEQICYSCKKLVDVKTNPSRMH